MAKFLGVSKAIMAEIKLGWAGLRDLRWQRPINGNKLAILSTSDGVDYFTHHTSSNPKTFLTFDCLGLRGQLTLSQ